MEDSDEEDATVDDLIAAANGAPSFGINARELLLQAARASHAIIQRHESPGQDLSHQCNSEPLIGAEELWAAVPVSERPTVAFILRNPKVPRALRQTVLNRLLVRELGIAAAASRGNGVRAVALLAVSQERRAACVSAAVGAELDLYKRSNNKSVYLNFATRLPLPSSAASSVRGSRLPQVGPAPSAAAEASIHKREREETGAEPAAISHQPIAPAELRIDVQDARVHHGAVRADVTRKKARSAKIDAEDIDWGATQSCPGGDWEHVSPVGVGPAPAPTPSDDAPPRICATDVQQRHESASATVTGTGGDWAAEAHMAVTRGVRAFVMAILDPLYAASVIDGKIYRDVARKVVDKVMAHHEQAADTDFLLTEGDHIHKLVQQYCQRMKRI